MAKASGGGAGHSGVETVKLSGEQNRALQALKTGRNVFLSGAAGTGKSTVLKAYLADARSRGARVIVCAPTGIAALNVQGTTIHKAFGAKLVPYLNEPDPVKVPEILAAAQVVVIDEISMCRIDLFQFVGRVIQAENARRRKRRPALPPIQLIVVGDFFQLPPVLKENDRLIIDETYGEGKKYAFQAPAWKHFAFVPVVLEEVVRQDNGEFIGHLNDIRRGETSGRSWFEQNTNPQLNRDAIFLCSRNKKASEINQGKLEALRGGPSIFRAIVSGKVREGEFPTEEALVLKTGARVIMLNNDSEGRWVNGTMATVSKIGPSSISVRTQGGLTAEVARHTWEFEEYAIEPKTKRLTKVPVGSFEQYPMRLAYAITIHKSQGQTFESANIDPNAFDTGMLYVALSRVKTPGGIHLLSEIKKESIRVDQAVVEFYRELDWEAPAATEVDAVVEKSVVEKPTPAPKVAVSRGSDAQGDSQGGARDVVQAYRALCEEAEGLWEKGLAPLLEESRKKYPNQSESRLRQVCSDALRKKRLLDGEFFEETVKRCLTPEEKAHAMRSAALRYQIAGAEVRARKLLTESFRLRG